MRIALISPPWLAPYRPSIQLGTLRAWVRQRLPTVEVDVFHDHLAIAGWMRYPVVRTVADGVPSSWLGEALAAYLLFPERRPVLDRFLDYLVDGREPQLDLEHDLLLPYGRYIRDRVRSVDWSSYDLVGISVTLCQTLGATLLARRIRQASARPLLVFGGPVVSGRMGRSFLDTFPELDAVVSGEGEQALVGLLEALAAGRPLGEQPGVLVRGQSLASFRPAPELPDLDELPCPDYDGYFATLASLPAADRTLVEADLELPLEGSRGCWWDRRHCRNGSSCQFCNLNLQWKQYREKTVDKQLAELEQLAGRHGHRAFLFVDNVTRRHQADAEDLFTRLAGLERPLRIYMEARANLPPPMWRLLHEAGVTACQIGIESLCTTVLRKIGKGTTALQNLAAMKELERWGIANPGNLLYDLPEMTVAEVEENIARVRLARAYHPLGATRLFLNYGSPYYQRFFGENAPQPDAAGAAAAGASDRNYRAWQVLLPPEVESTLFLSERDFEGTVPGMAEVTARFDAECRDWAAHYAAAKAAEPGWLLWSEPDPLQPGALLVHDRRQAEARLHRLEGPAARLLELFEWRQPLACWRTALPELDEETMEAAFAALEAAGLLLREGKEALALPLGRWPAAPRS